MSDFLETIDRCDKLLQMNMRVSDGLNILRELAKKGEEENNGAGLTLETCEAGAEQLKKIENRLERMLGGIHRTHELLSKYSEGNKPFP